MNEKERQNNDISVESSELEFLITYGVIASNEFCRKTVKELKPEFFDFPMNDVVKIVKNNFVKYKNSPSLKALATELKEQYKDYSDRKEKYKKFSTFFKEMKNHDFNVSEEFDWLYEKTKTFIKRNHIREAIIESADILQNEDLQTNQGEFKRIEENIRNAVGLKFDENLGLDYFRDLEERYQRMKDEEEVIPTGLSDLDKVLAGGWHPGSLNVVLGATNCGKSLCLANMATNLVKTGTDVLYLTLELVEDEIAKRIDGKFSRIKISDIPRHPERAKKRIRQFENKRNPGRFFIKEFSPGFSASDLEIYLQELNLKEDFTPDVIVLDYLNEMSPEHGTTDNSYTDLSNVVKRLRSVAVSMHVPLLTASQVNREGYGKVSGLENTADSMGISFRADFILLLFQDEELEEDDMLEAHVLKNRFGRKGGNFPIYIDYDILEMRDKQGAKQSKMDEKMQQGRSNKLDSITQQD